MAGILPSRKRTGRKQWTLHDGPTGSLNRLRNQLANEGCPESQVVLAKQLLEEECDLDVDQQENARMGVYWLIKASEQGNSEATDLLSQCLVTGRGITEHNVIDVKTCIDMTQDEKIARKAAREMFASLSNGEDYITSEQLQKRMLEIINSVDNKSANLKSSNQDIRNGLENGEIIKNEASDESEEETDWSSRDIANNEKLTEDNLVSAAINYTHGILPVVNRRLRLTHPNLNSLDNVPYFQRSIQHPFLAVKILYYKLIRFLGQPRFSVFLRTDFQIFLLIIYSLSSVENIFLLLPMVCYYSSLVAMILTTFQVLQSNRNFQDFRIWSQLFLTYSGGSLNPEEAEYQFVKNNLKPYGQFFVGLLVNFIIYPMIAQEWLPQSEITILSFCLMFMTLLTFMVKERKFPDWLILFSFAINVLAKYPYETDPVVTQGWRFLDLKTPTLASYIVGNGIEFCLNFRMLLYAIIPFICLHIAQRQKWRGMYKYLIPHCMTLSWLQIVVINSQGATMFGLLRGTLALVGIVLFLPLVGITTILLPALAFAKWFTNNFMFSIAVFVGLTVTGLMISFLLSKTRFNRYISILQLFLAVITGCLLLHSIVESHIEFAKPTINEINWETYQNYCHQPAWDNDNMANTQIRCHKLENNPVSWNGYINEVKLKSVRNNYKYLIDKLPFIFSDILYCYFGEPAEENCDNVADLFKEGCQIWNSVMRKCHLDKLNVYEFEISIKMQSGIWGKSAEVILFADNPFTNFSLQLRPNDKIFFKGLLMHNPSIGSDGLLGGLKPHVRLSEIGCLACHMMNLTFFKSEIPNYNVNRLVEVIFDGLKFIFNILLHPVFVFK